MSVMNDALANLECELKLDDDGSILAVISKKSPQTFPEGNTPKNEFQLQMRFELNRTLTDVDGVKTDTFSWTLHDARTVMSKDK